MIDRNREASWEAVVKIQRGDGNPDQVGEDSGSGHILQVTKYRIWREIRYGKRETLG